MRHRPRAALAALAACGGVCGSVGAVAAAGTGTGTSVTGSAVNGYPTPAGPGSARLTVSAFAGASGASGVVQADGTSGTPMGQFHVAGPVTCVLVVGNQASIKYRFTQASGMAAMFQGGGVEVFIQDNGRPSNGQPVDENAFNPPMDEAAFDLANPSQCDPPATGAYSRVRSGDYTIAPGSVTQGGHRRHHGEGGHRRHGDRDHRSGDADR